VGKDLRGQRNKHGKTRKKRKTGAGTNCNSKCLSSSSIFTFQSLFADNVFGEGVTNRKFELMKKVKNFRGGEPSLGKKVSRIVNELKGGGEGFR